MQNITHSVIGFLALSTLCGVAVHDLHIDKLTTHIMSQHQSDMSINSHAHTHSERNSLGGKTQASIARDPREDKGGQHHNQSDRDYFRLPGQADLSDHTIVLA